MIILYFVKPKRTYDAKELMSIRVHDGQMLAYRQDRLQR